MAPVRRTLLVALAASAALASCSSESSTSSAELRETRGPYTIVHLKGTPYEMGHQHGTVMKEELRQAIRELEENPLLRLMRQVALSSGFDKLALQNSYPEIIEECQGMVDAASDVGWGMTECIVLNTGDMVAEFVTDGSPTLDKIAPGCLQVMSTAGATKNGKMYHARILDWYQIDYVVGHPTIFVREPDGGVPHVTIGFPGNIAPYQGMNAEGLVVASNEVHARDATVHDTTGKSHVQMVARILATSRTLEDARALVTSADHMTLELIGVSDAKSKRAEVYEMAPAGVGVRTLDDDGTLFVTNHFVTPEMDPLDREPRPEHSVLRWDRLAELVSRRGKATHYGALDPETLVSVLRDRVNPYTGVIRPESTFDDGESIATDGALYAVVFDGEAREFWLSAGTMPIPSQTFTGFSLGELLRTPDHKADRVGPIQ